MKSAKQFNLDMKRKNKIVWPDGRIKFFKTYKEMERYFETYVKKTK